MLIYVVGYDAVEPNSVSGFDWFRTPEGAKKAFDNMANDGNEHYQLTLDVEVEDSQIRNGELDNDDITAMVERYLMLNNFSHAPGCWDVQLIERI